MRCFALALALAVVLPAVAAEQRRMCVFDPGGQSGDFFNLIKDYRAAALEWGVQFDLRVYTDEKTASEDLKAGHCHTALLTGTRTRQFNKFTGTIEAIGGLPSYDHLRTAVHLLMADKAASRMREGDYETIAMFPAGAVFLFVRDRAINSVEALAGRRIATLDFDRASIAMVRRVGAAMVAAEIASFGSLFNNGQVDVCYAPSAAYQALELYRGIEENGAVLKEPLGQLTVQVVARADANLPEGFADASRQYAARQFDAALGLWKRADALIPARYWIVPEGRERYDAIYRASRIELRDAGVYDATMLRLMRRVRCKHDPTQAECAEKTE